MKFKIYALAILIFILTVGAVSAQDANPTEPTGIDDADFTVSQSNDKTFTDLNNDLANAITFLELNSDYSFVQGDDDEFKNGMAIDGKNLIINGNGHVIDANSLSRVFTINSSNLTLNNLIIKNAVNTAITTSNTTICTNNVTFIRNAGGENGGVLYIDNTNYTSANDKFLDNYASRFGSAIFVKDNCNFNAINSTFKGNDLYWGLIEIRKSQFDIVNSTFANSTSKYSTAIHSEGGNGKIRNSKFINLTASVTAGALAFKEFDGTISVENSIFSNVKSSKNAGAIFVDMVGADSEYEGEIIISDSQFINCSSEFGGALLQLTGNLTIINSNFTDNAASENGGAIYTSWADAEIGNTLFFKNDAKNNGGAIFFDIGTLNVKNSNFSNNKAETGGAIYLYDSNYTISNSCFKDNTENIYSLFDGEINSLTNNNMINGKINVGNVDYKYSYDIKNINLNYNPITYDLSLANQSYFDLRELGLVTSAKSQGFMGSCWTFGSAAALESAILKATNKTVVLDISENNLRNNALKYAFYGSDSAEAGDGQNGGQYFLSFGAVSEDMDSYDELGKISKSLDDADRYYLFKIIKIPYRLDVNDNYKFKEALVKYGALSIGVSSHDRNHAGDYNNKTAAAYYYNEGNPIPDHEVTLVGWNDNYPASNFINTPPGDGAWIVKNSWGTDWGDEGYYYVSYYDSGILRGEGAIAFEIIDSPSFEKVYQYDTNGGIMWGRKIARNLTEEEQRLPNEEIIKIMDNITIPSTFANTYKATGDDLITAVGTYMNSKDKDYTIWISVNGKEVFTQSGKSSYNGFEVINLNEYVSIEPGDNFTVKIESFITSFIGTRNKVQTGMSYNDYLGKWQDLTLDGNVASIKAYTISKSQATLKVSDVDVVYGNDAKVIATLISGEVPVVGANVEVTFNGEIYDGVTDKDGKAVLTIPANVVPNKYAAKITSGILSQTFYITVKEVTPNVAPEKKTLDFKDNTYKAKTTGKSYTLYRLSDMKVICHNVVSLKALSDLFNLNLSNGHMRVYIDGILIFEGDVGDDLTEVIFEIIEKFLGKHKITVEFTGSDGKTKTLNEPIIIE